MDCEIASAPEMPENNMACNRKTVAKSLRRQGLCAKAGKKFKATTHSKHHHPVAPNLLDQDFNASGPNQKWAMSERINTELVCNALKMPLWRRVVPKKGIVHSDRGSQYCSKAYQKLLKAHDLRPSMSGKGNCYGNACSESFFHSLKVEAIHGERFTSREEMRKAVFEYIEADYNRTRRYSACGLISPQAFEAKYAA